jgi:hypothetical protein
MTEDVALTHEFADWHEIEKQLKRINKLPRSGNFTLLHHLGPVVEPTHDVMERVKYIVEEKPRREVLTRLQNIHYVSKYQTEYYISWIRTFFEICEPDGPTRRQERHLSVNSPMQMIYGTNIPWQHLRFRLKANQIWLRLEVMWLRSISPDITWNGRSIFPISQST